MKPPGLPEIEAARERVYAAALRSPLIRLGVDEGPEIWLKLENLQPIGSFKIRGSANAIGLIPPAELAAGVWTASAGNMAQGVAWNARRLGVPCSVVVPETAPRLKLDAIARLGATAVKTSVASWFEVFRTQRFDGMDGRFVHAFMDRDVMAGNGTIAVELIEDLPGVDAVIVPFGGGGLACGIAAGMRALAPDVPVFASEVHGPGPVRGIAARGPRRLDLLHALVRRRDRGSARGTRHVGTGGRSPGGFRRNHAPRHRGRDPTARDPQTAWWPRGPALPPSRPPCRARRLCRAR